jgi:hypothetical protein
MEIFRGLALWIKSDFNRRFGILLWPVLMVFLIDYFYDGLSPAIFDRYHLWIMFLSDISVGFLLLLTVATLYVNFRSFRRIFDGNGIFAVFFGSVIFIIGFPVSVLYLQMEKSSRLLKEEGVFAMANILGSRSLDLYKVDLSHVKLGFYDDKRIYHQVDEDVNAHTVEYIREKGLLVPIVYVRSYPSILNIILDRKSIEQYSHSHIRELSMTRLARLLSWSDSGAAKQLKELKKENVFWDAYHTRSFRNLITEEELSFDKNGEIKYFAPLGVGQAFSDERRDSFLWKRERDVQGRVTYINDSFSIICKRHFDMHIVDKQDFHLRVNAMDATVRRKSNVLP